MSKEKKICFVSTLSYSLFFSDKEVTFGGSEVQMFFLSNKLSEDERYEVSVVIGDFGQKKKKKYKNMMLYSSYSLKKNIINYLIAPIKLFLTFFIISPDIIITRGYGAEVGIAKLYSLIFRKNLIYMIAHDSDVKGTYFKGLLGKIFQFGFTNADFLIAQNDFQLKQYKKKYKKNNIIKLNNSFFIEKKEKVKKNYILWIARSDPWKNPELFINLAKKFPKEKFVMIMPKSSDLETWNKYYKLAKKQKNITFIKSVPFKDVQRYFDEAKIFINTSEYEGFPNTFIQAGLGKTPILSYKVNPSDIIEKYNIGFFAKGNFDLMKNQLEELINNKKIWVEKSKNIFKYVEKNHNIDKNIIKFKEFLESFLIKIK